MDKLQIKKWLKKLPIINYWHKNRHHAQQIAIAQQQLCSAITQLSLTQRRFIATQKLAKANIKNNLIVSLTTFGCRAEQVYLTLLSILAQTVQPEKILLWLAEDEFTPQTLPSSIKALAELGVEVSYCQDTRSYKKLLPALAQYPEHTVITIDDDVIYPQDHLEKLLKTSERYPNAVVCHLAHRIGYRAAKQGHGLGLKSNDSIVADNILPYALWDNSISAVTPSKDVFPVGIGGVLYPPNCLDEEVFNQKQYMSLCPHADDIWFKMMALKKGTLAMVVDNPMPYRAYLHIPNSQISSLWQINAEKNDQQLRNVLAAYNTIELR